MDSTLITSSIAFCGVIASAFISLGIANRTAKLQIAKIRYEVQHSRAEKLAEKRLETYSSLYSLLNEMNFLIQERNSEIERFERINTAMLEWYLHNGILLSSKSNSLLWQFIKRYRKLCQGGKNAIAGSLGTGEQRRAFIKKLDSIELELKNEIGIFEIEYFDPNARFTSYSELMSFYREKNAEEANSPKSHS